MSRDQEPNCTNRPLRWIRANAPNTYRKRLEKLAKRGMTVDEWRLLEWLHTYSCEIPPSGYGKIATDRDAVSLERLITRGYVRYETDDRYPMPVVRLYPTEEGNERFSVYDTQRRLAKAARRARQRDE